MELQARKGGFYLPLKCYLMLQAMPLPCVYTSDEHFILQTAIDMRSGDNLPWT